MDYALTLLPEEITKDMVKGAVSGEMLGDYRILTVHVNAGYTHWTLLYDNKYYDPEFGLIEGEYIYGKITSFLGIYI